jgi:hypothetical protein
VPWEDMGSVDTIAQWEVNNKWIYAGTLVSYGENDERTGPKLFTINLRKPEQLYHVHIGLSMLAAVGGKFDDNDTVYADIYEVDGQRIGPPNRNQGNQPPNFATSFMRSGYVYGHHFGPIGDKRNQGPSVFLGRINAQIVLRLFVQGDDYAAASYSIVEL